MWLTRNPPSMNHWANKKRPLGGGSIVAPSYRDGVSMCRPPKNHYQGSCADGPCDRLLKKSNSKIDNLKKAWLKHVHVCSVINQAITSTNVLKALNVV